LRVAILSTSYPRFAGDPSGHFVEAEAALLARAGRDVHVVAPGLGRAAGARSGVTIHDAGAARLFGLPGALHRAKEKPARLVELPGFARRTLSLLGSIDPDAIIAHFLIPSGYPLALFSRADLEVVAHGTDVRIWAKLPSRFRTHIVGRLVDRRARFRFSSRSVERALVSGLAPDLASAVAARSRVEPPHFSIPDLEDPKKRARAIAGSDEPLLVACSRLIAKKRVDLAIEHAAARGMMLVVVGDGPERASLERLAARRGARVRFVGALPRPEALGFIACASELVHMSEEEGSPTVVREARALGVPVLAAAAGDVAIWAAHDPGITVLSGSG
jgi:teichuronic acid biosynthesis glycosyltransferase TuaC